MPTAGSASEGPGLSFLAAPPAAVDDRPTLFERLEKSNQGLDDLKAPAKAQAAKAPAAKAPAAKAPSESRQAPAQADLPPVAPPVTKAPRRVAVASPPPPAKPAPAPPKPGSLAASKPAPPTTAASDTKPAGDTKPGYAVQVAAVERAQRSRRHRQAPVRRRATRPTWRCPRERLDVPRPGRHIQDAE